MGWLFVVGGINMAEVVKIDEGIKTPAKQRGSAWPAGVACVCFGGLSVFLLRAYGLLHWKIINHNLSTLDGALRTDLFRLLGFLEIYHLTALVSVIFGIWAFRGEPGWIRWVCLPVIALSVLIFFVVM